MFEREQTIRLRYITFAASIGVGAYRFSHSGRRERGMARYALLGVFASDTKRDDLKANVDSVAFLFL